MDPTIVTLANLDGFPNLDQHWVQENITRAADRIATSIPERYADATVTEPAVARWVRAVVAEAIAESRSDCISVHTGPSLLMLGITGTGKTHQAYGAIRALAVTGVQCRWMFTTAADMYAALRPRPKVDSEEEFRRYATARLLVIDDLGAAKGSEWVEEINYRLINHRYEHKLPTLITSNLLPKELGAALGERVTSRLVEMAGRVVIEGSDRRRNLRPAS